LKVRFARLRCFYENLKEPHLPKMRTIGASRRHAPDGAQDKPRSARASPIRTAFALARQRTVHHATDDSPSTGDSPSRANGDGEAPESRGSAGENTGARPALAFV
jgi:hypothetical protein